MDFGLRKEIKIFMRYLIIALFLFMGNFGYSNPNPSSFQLSSHILDINTGAPASGVKIQLYKLTNSGEWKLVEEKITDKDGRIKDFLKYGNDNKGIYKLNFIVKPYFESKGQNSFYPFIEVVFEINSEDHFHVPLTLSPFGYSTYRGS